MINERNREERSTDVFPLVSIVIPVYNAERTLSSCLDSVFAQTYVSFEVILIDDGSKDSSAEICDTYASRYPDKLRYFRQENSGPATARNVGIGLSKGKYIAFVDADDRISPKLIETMTEKAEESGAQMVICSYWLINDKGETSVSYDFPEGLYSDDDCRRIAMSVLTESKGGIPPYSWVRLTSKSVFVESGLRFQNGMVRSEDYHFWTKVHFYLDKLYLLSNTPLYEYVDNSQSITHRHVKGYWTDVLSIYHDLCARLPQDEDIAEALKMMLVKRSLIALNNAARSTQIAQARKEINDIISNETLLRAITSLEKTEKKNFVKYRYLMNHQLGNIVALKYFFRTVRYRMRG